MTERPTAALAASIPGGFALLLGAATLIAFSAAAHEKATALTDLLYNERTGNLEIAHRISLHDAEHALRKVKASKADLAVSEKAQKAFADYVADRFRLTLPDKTPLPLTLVGQEIEGGYLWVYQETKLPKPVDTPFSIENTILLDVVKDQLNTVNVRYRSRVSTFLFKAGSGAKRFPGPEVAAPAGGKPVAP